MGKISFEQCKKDFIKKINSFSRFNATEVFSDFVELSAYALQNSCYFRDDLEKKYKDIIKKYTKPEQTALTELFSYVVFALEDKFGDFLGNCFEEIGVSNSKTGQFFTPYHLSKLCAESVLSKEDIEEKIKKRGYVKINEPASGSGGMIIAYCETIKNLGINYQNSVLVIAQDIDYRCAYMCYIQLSLLGVTAKVIIGDTLKLETWEVLYTPFYVLRLNKFKESEEEKEQIKQPEQLTLF